jgi:glycosyltransferase involved in cell wall biosynthesis
MRILIICNDYPPLNTVAAERPLGWVNHLPHHGIQLTVVTKAWKGPETDPRHWSYGQAKQQTQEVSPTVSIIRVPNKMNPTDWMIRTWGWNKWGSLRKVFTFLWNIGSFFSDRFDRHAHLYAAAKNQLKSQPVDLILATANPWQNFRHAARLSKDFGIPWVADYRDGWYLSQETIRRKGVVHRLVRAIEWNREKKFVGTSVALTTASPALTDFYSFLLEKPAYTVYNGYRDLPENMPDVHGPAKLLLVHNGTLKPTQDIEFLLDALDLLWQNGSIAPGDVELRMVGLEHFPDQAHRVTSYKPHLAPFVTLTPRLPRHESMAQIQSADALIALSDPYFQAIYTKVIEYIAVQKPIWVMPDDRGLMRNLVADLGQGAAFKQVKDLAQALLKAIQSPESLRSKTYNEEAARFFSRQHQAGVMADVLREVLANHQGKRV